MTVSPKSRLLSLVAAVAIVATVACVDSPTAPQVNGDRASLDTTTFVQGDSTECRSGYTIFNGRIVCNET
jgi:hypothetical protein